MPRQSARPRQSTRQVPATLRGSNSAALPVAALPIEEPPEVSSAQWAQVVPVLRPAPVSE